MFGVGGVVGFRGWFCSGLVWFDLEGSVVGEKGNVAGGADAVSSVSGAGDSRSLVEGASAAVYGGAVDVTTDVGSKLHEKVIEHAADHAFEEGRERLRRDDGDEVDGDDGGGGSAGGSAKN